jgi:NAD+ kinase
MVLCRSRGGFAVRDDARVSEPRSVRRIGVVVHPRRELDDAMSELRGWASGAGAEVVQVPMPGVERVVAEPATSKSCDLVVALGGDGTTLAALHAAGRAGRPVLGAACGSLGALTATSADQIAEALQAFVAGEWQPRRLPAIVVTPEGGTPEFALNDFVAVRNGASQITVAIEVDGDLYARFAGDGVVVATPLGSSAYTMAAGGPIVAPGTDAFVVTPLAPHGGTCPPLVVARGSRLRLTIEPGYYGARVELDGHVHDLPAGELAVGWRRDYATLVTLGGAETLLVGLRRRRILMDSPRVLARDDRAAAIT